MVIVHEQDAGEGQDQEEIKRDAPHPPSESVADRVAVDFGGMEVEENVREDAEGAAAVRVVVLDPKHGLEKLRLLRPFEAFAFLFNFSLQVLDLFLEPFCKHSRTLKGKVKEEGESLK